MKTNLAFLTKSWHTLIFGIKKMWYLRFIFASFSWSTSAKFECRTALQPRKNCEKQISVTVLPVCEVRISIKAWRNLQWFITESFSTATNPCQKKW